MRRKAETPLLRRGGWRADDRHGRPWDLVRGQAGTGERDTLPPSPSIPRPSGRVAHLLEERVCVDDLRSVQPLPVQAHQPVAQQPLPPTRRRAAPYRSSPSPFAPHPPLIARRAGRGRRRGRWTAKCDAAAEPTPFAATAWAACTRGGVKSGGREGRQVLLGGGGGGISQGARFCTLEVARLHTCAQGAISSL